jgi:hypothetical protein
MTTLAVLGALTYTCPFLLTAWTLPATRRRT